MTNKLPEMEGSILKQREEFKLEILSRILVLLTISHSRAKEQLFIIYMQCPNEIHVVGFKSPLEN